MTLKNLIFPEIRNKITIIFALIFVLALQGCLSQKTSSTPGNGSIVGTINYAEGSVLVAKSETFSKEIPISETGDFHAQLPSGNYKIYLQTIDGKLTLINDSIQIEDNLSVTVVNSEMVPIPQAISVSVPLLYDTSAVIEWETDLPSDGYVEYGTNEIYGYSAYAEEGLKTRHRVQLFNLLPNTQYHFRIGASRYNLDSSTSLSRDFVFTTEP